MTSSNGNIFRVTGHLCGEFPGEFPAQRPVTWSFDVFFDLRLNKRLSKQWWGWWFETLSHPLWRHRNVTGIPACGIKVTIYHTIIMYQCASLCLKYSMCLNIRFCFPLCCSLYSFWSYHVQPILMTCLWISQRVILIWNLNIKYQSANIECNSLDVLHIILGKAGSYQIPILLKVNLAMRSKQRIDILII